MRNRLYPSDFKCDYRGCRLLPLVEVIYEEDDWHWSYLCLFHFIQYWIVNKGEIGYCLADWLCRMPLVSRIWNLIIK